MKIRNLTPHSVVLVDSANNVIRTFKSEGVARASQQTQEAGMIDGMRLVRMTFGQPTDLPTPEEGTMLIVSAITVSAARASGRTTSDLLLTADAVRGENGQIVGCRALALAD